MNIIQHKWQLSRRAMLRGLGTTLALPWLEAMSPLAKSFANAGGAAPGEIPTRLGFLHYVLGMQRLCFFPEQTGAQCELSRIMKQVEPSRGEFTIFSNIFTAADQAGHAREVSFLTGVNPTKNGGFKNAISYDQIAAGTLGQATRFPSLTLSQKKGTAFGGNLISTLSWNRAGIPIAAESRPQVLFAKLFRPETAADRTTRVELEARQRSVLDAVAADAKRMNAVLGRNDREKLDEYLNSVRELEQQIARVDAWSNTARPQADAKPFGNLDKPFDFADCAKGQLPFKEYSRLMFDLIALAWQTDSTRVITYAARQNILPADFGGPINDHHAMTHDGGDAVKLEAWAKLDELYMSEFNYFLQKLKSIKEGTGTLLDHTLVGFSSEMNGTHSNLQLPTVLAGGRSLGVKHQTHVKCKDMTLVGNLWETMLVKAKVPLQGHLANSSGILPEIL